MQGISYVIQSDTQAIVGNSAYGEVPWSVSVQLSNYPDKTHMVEVRRPGCQADDTWESECFWVHFSNRVDAAYMAAGWVAQCLTEAWVENCMKTDAWQKHESSR